MRCSLCQEELFNFFTALDKAHGAISGSMALAIYQPSEFMYWEPRNLNLVVPWQEVRTMGDFLRSIGYAKDSDCRIPFRWYHLVRRHLKFCKAGHLDIFLSESYDETAMPIILGTSTTAMMNALTSTTYYSFYPNMTSRQEVVPNWPGPIAGDKDKFKARGYKFFDYAPRAGTSQCGQGCTLEARRVRGRRGIGVLTWSTSHENSAKLDEDPIVWQLGEECPYRHCQNRLKVGLLGQR